MPDDKPKEPELTCEDKAAIRGYLLKLVTLPALILSALSFMLGYSIQEGAAGRALTDATKQVMPEIAKATHAAALATASAEQTKLAADKTKNELQQIEALQKALQQTDKLAQDVAKAIEPNVKELLGKRVYIHTDLDDVSVVTADAGLKVLPVQKKPNGQRDGQKWILKFAE